MEKGIFEIFHAANLFVRLNGEAVYDGKNNRVYAFSEKVERFAPFACYNKNLYIVK